MEDDKNSRSLAESEEGQRARAKWRKPQDKKPAAGAKDVEKPLYTPTPTEAAAIKAYLAVRAKEKRAPRLKFSETGKNATHVDLDHPDSTVGPVALMQAVGTADGDFLNGLIGQIVDASKLGEASEGRANFMLSAPISC